MPAGNTHIDIENSALGCMYTGAGGELEEILLLPRLTANFFKAPTVLIRHYSCHNLYFF